MIFNTVGGAGLNFKVVGGTTQPTSPKENTIWVNTSTTITSWWLSADEPETPSEGMVWLRTGRTSSVAFNALKNNTLNVYPISAKQYVSGAWVDRKAKIYQGGEWLSLALYLYKNGDQFVEITGGWKYSSLGWGLQTKSGSVAYGEYLTVKTNDGGVYDATTSNKIDLTGYRELLYDIAPDSSTDNQIVIIHGVEPGGDLVADSTPQWAPQWAAASNNGVISLDGLNGLYYISVVSTGARTMKIGNIRLV